MRCPSDEDLALHASGVDVPSVAAHQRGCDACDAIISALRASDTLPQEPALELPALPAPGETIGRYVIIRRLGRGGMGDVFLAYDPLRDRSVALKSIRPEGLGTPDRVLRFKREFRIARDLQHPHLVRLGELFEHRGRWCFTMELIRGVELLAHLRGGAPAPAHDGPCRCDVDKLRAAAIQLARALDAMHRAGLVHRDVKPSNVLVDGDGRLVLVDFGIAMDREDSLVETPRVVGTVAYMAPEQIRAEPVGPAADWYALGVVLFVALTGAPPFTGSADHVMAAKLVSDGPAPSSRASGIPADLDRLCERLLSLEPAMRPSVDVILQMLGASTPASSTASSAFVGREAVLATVSAHAVAGATGPAILTLEGEAGIGKSTLAARAVATWRRAEPHALILRGRCDDREAIPFNAIDGIIDDLGRHLARVDEAELDTIADHVAELARIFPVLPTRAAPVTVPAAEPIAARRRAFSALREVLRHVAAHRRVFLVIDDVQWADADSLAALDALLAPGAPPLLLLATVRSTSTQPWQPPPCFGDATRLELGGLEPTDLRAMATTFDRTDVDIARLHADTGGNPMLVEQWLSLPASAGVPPPSAFGAVVAARTAQLSGAAAAVLATIAVAGRPVSERVVTSAAALDPTSVEAAIAELTATRFARRDGLHTDMIDVWHARIRDQVYAGLDRAQCSRLHGRMADVLIAVGGPADWIASQLSRAGHIERASSFARTAAAAAEQTLAFDRAAALYRLALSGAATGDGPLLRAQLASALANAGRPEDAAQEFLAAAGASTDPAARLELRRRAAEQYLAGGYLGRGLAEANALLTESGGGRLPASDARAVVALVAQRARLAMRPMRWQPRPEHEIAQSVLTDLDLHWSLSIGLAWVDSLRGAVFGTRLPLLCLPHGEEFRIARATCAAAVSYAAMGARRATRRMIAAATRAAAGHRSELARFYAALARLSSDFFLDNDWRATAERTTELATMWRSAGRGGGWEADIVEQFGAFAGFWLGRFRAVASRVDVLAERAADAGNRFQEVGLRAYFGALDTLLGDPELCDRRVRRALERAQGDRANLNYAYWTVRSRSYAAIYRGDVATLAGELDRRWAELKHSLLLRIPTTAAEAYAAIGGYELACAALARSPSVRRDRLAAARHIARQVRRSPLFAGRMTFHNLAAGIAHVAGDDEAALRSLRAAEATYDAAGMAGQVAAVRLRLATLLGGSQGAALRTAALAWFTREQIPDPDRTASCLCPGWHPDAP